MEIKWLIKDIKGIEINKSIPYSLKDGYYSIDNFLKGVNQPANKELMINWYRKTTKQAKQYTIGNLEFTVVSAPKSAKTICNEILKDIKLQYNGLQQMQEFKRRILEAEFITTGNKKALDWIRDAHNKNEDKHHKNKNGSYRPCLKTHWIQYINHTNTFMADTETCAHLNKEIGNGIKIINFYKKNKHLRPYIYLFGYRLFKGYNDDPTLLNYNETAKFFDNLTNKSLFYFHNLSYDMSYIATMLVDTYNYTIRNIGSKELKQWILENKELCLKLKVIDKNGKVINTDKAYKKMLNKKEIFIKSRKKRVFTSIIKNSKNTIIEFKCTYLTLMASIDDLGKTVGIPKLKDYDYHRHRPKDYQYTQDDFNYMKNDIAIAPLVYKSIEEKFEKVFHKQLNWKLTVGSTAMSLLKEFINNKKYGIGRKQFSLDFNQLNTIEALFTRNYYKGGYANFNPWYVGVEFNNDVFNLLKNFHLKTEQEKQNIKDLLVKTGQGYIKDNKLYINYNNLNGYLTMGLDITSSYPANMKYLNLPYGESFNKKIVKCNKNCDHTNLETFQIEDGQYHFKELVLNDKVLSNKSEFYKQYIVKITNTIYTKFFKNMKKSSILGTSFLFLQPDGTKISKVEYAPFINRGQTLFLDQYGLMMLYDNYNINDDDDINVKLLNAFRHKVHTGISANVKTWQVLKSETKEIMKTDSSVKPFYSFIKFIINGSSGKFAEKEYLDRTEWNLTIDNQIETVFVQDKELEDIENYKYVPFIAAITSIARLRLYSMIEFIGWDNWIVSDTDSIKLIYKKELLDNNYKPNYSTEFYNMVTDEIEKVFSETDDFGFWDFENIYINFLCVGKKKYMFSIWNANTQELETYIKVAGATPAVKKTIVYPSVMTPELRGKAFPFITDIKLENANVLKTKWINGVPYLNETTFGIKSIHKGLDLNIEQEYKINPKEMQPFIDQMKRRELNNQKYSKFLQGIIFKETTLGSDLKRNTTNLINQGDF